MRIKYRREPDPISAWDEIIPGLFMGGHIRRGPSGERIPVVVGAEFDVVISLYRENGHGPADAVEHHCREIPDGPLTAAQLADICELAETATAAVRCGRKVLVRCHSGYNRSGLVVVQTLVHLGYDVDDAIFLVRYRRSKWALNYQLFVDYLTTGLDVASLLVDLDG
ncbi:MAG: dual specificity protein phosphatase family protein [Actinobacteria bacterium]|nr:dual specificity protein phosphatase family protein [Actinomycetota bacterium]MBO0837763.1 dual specificity protein phosphatase family protein [Actinomycetota bacterium]